MGTRLTGFRLDPGRTDPMYQQLFDQIVERVRSGTFPEGFRLPPTRSLAQELGAHRNTVVRTYAELEAAGFVVSSVGRGTFVAASRSTTPEPARAQRPGLPWSSLVAPNAVAEPLGRFDRLARASQRDDLVQLASMHPSADLLPIDLFRRCLDHTLRTIGTRALAYGPREGVPRLRALIAEDLGRQGVPATPDDVVVTTGSQQALDLVARALVRPGDTFAVDALTYPGAANVLFLAGASLVGIPGDDEGPSVMHMSQLSGLKGYYAIPRGHNPTGVTMSLRRGEALLDWSHHRGVPIVEDDYGADLSLEDEPPPPPLRALDRDVIYVGSFSKKLIPAIRIGFVVCPPALRSVLVSLKHTLDLGTSALLQHALAEFLERGYLRAHLARVVQPEYRARRDALEAGLSAHLPAGVRWRRSVGALHLWLPLPSGYNPEEVADEARRKGVMVTPSTLYALEPRDHAGLRLTFCAETPERLREGARRLGRALAAVAPRHAPGARQEASMGVV